MSDQNCCVKVELLGGHHQAKYCMATSQTAAEILDLSSFKMAYIYRLGIFKNSKF